MQDSQLMTTEMPRAISAFIGLLSAPSAKAARSMSRKDL
jgi:hypothetical protein